MRVFAIDPGSAKTGFVVWYDDQKHVEQRGTLANDVFLDLVAELADQGHEGSLVCAIEDFDPQPVDGFISKHSAETKWIMGRIYERWLMLSGQAPYLIKRNTILSHFSARKRLAVDPHGRKVKAPSRDSQIRTALIERFGPPGTKKNPGALYGVVGHEWQALALGVCHCDRQRLPF